MAGEPPAGPRVETTIRYLPVGLVTIDLKGRVAAANPAALEILGPSERVVGAEFALLFPPEGEGLAKTLATSLYEGLPAHLVAVPFRSPGSRRLRVIDVAVAPLYEGNRAAGAVAVVTDVSERAQELARARLFYQSFLHSHEAMEVTDHDGVLVDVNPAFERIYGIARADAIGKKPSIVRSERTPPEVYEHLWRELLDPAIGQWSGELVNVDRQGREHPVLLSIDAIRNEAGEITHFLGVATDLTEQRAFELQVARTDRLASLGQLAAGVAHELNTPLANIMLIAESLNRRAPDPWVTGRAEAITQQVESAARIVSGLLDFSRHHPSALAEVDLVAVVGEAIGFAKGKHSQDVEFVESHAVRPLRIQGNRVQVLQVFVNIINNAVAAMDGDGTLTVTSGLDGQEAWVAFTDTGSGIPPSVLPHIFEPFFTTKPEGKGTGLGLSIVHGIVRAHGGTITVDSELGEGTTFTVRLPSQSVSSDSAGGASIAAARSPRLSGAVPGRPSGEKTDRIDRPGPEP